MVVPVGVVRIVGVIGGVFVAHVIVHTTKGFFVTSSDFFIDLVMGGEWGMVGGRRGRGVFSRRAVVEEGVVGWFRWIKGFIGEETVVFLDQGGDLMAFLINSRGAGVFVGRVDRRRRKVASR